MDALRLISSQASRQHGLITRSQARSLGLSDDWVDWRIKTGELERLHRGVLRLAGAPATWQQELLAACLAIPGAVASHRGAAEVWGLRDVPPCTEITVTGDHRLLLEGVVVHRTRSLAFRDRVWKDRIPVSSLPRTVLDLASVLPPESLEGVLDQLLARRRISVGQLRSYLKGIPTRGREGAGVLARMVEQRAGRTRHVDSGLQRRVEKLAAEAARAGQLPQPVFEHPVQLADGRWRYPDVAYPDYRVGIEAQSYEHHSTIHAFAKDLERTLDLMAEDWLLIPVTDVQLRKDFDGFARLVARVLAWRGPAWGTGACSVLTSPRYPRISQRGSF